MHVTITGLGRGGTSITGQVFSLHPRVEFRHEQSGFWLARNLGLSAFGRLTPGEATPERQKRLAAWARSPMKLLVEKDPRHVERLAFLRACWPEARFIYMLRDPRDLACSAHKGLIKSGRTIDDWMAQRGERMEATLKGLPPLVRILAWWRHVVQVDMDDMRGDPLFQVVQYEQLLRNPRGQFAALFHWVGLNMTPAVEKFLGKVSDDPAVHVSPLSAGNFVAGHRRRIGRWQSEWPEEQQAQALDIAGDLMHQWGYC